MQFTQINQDIPLLYRPRFLESESFSYESRTGSKKYRVTPPSWRMYKNIRLHIYIYMKTVILKREVVRSKFVSRIYMYTHI